MNNTADLIKAIRTGRLADVSAALDGGAQVELNDGEGDPGLPLGIACFMGFVDIVRLLVTRGATVNAPDNSAPTSPLSMALRGGRKEVARALLELGAELPAGMKTGLSDKEVMLAQWKAHSEGKAAQQAATPVENTHAFEEIQMVGCIGTDTMALDAEVIRVALEMEEKKRKPG